MKSKCILILFLLFSRILFAQWNPDAGIIPSLTNNATLLSSSMGSGLNNVLDHNLNTSWQSDAPLPYDFINKASQNFLFQKAKDWCSGTGTNYDKLTDGDTNTAASVVSQNGNAVLVFQFPTPIDLLTLSTKLNVANNLAVQFFAFTTPTDSVLMGSYSSNVNYNIVRLEFPKGKITTLKAYSTASFQAFEMAILASPPKEYVTVDLGKTQLIEQIETRHWSGGGAIATQLYLSNDNINWTPVATLMPDALHPVLYQITPSQSARYIKLEHTLSLKDWNKVYVWEIAAYGKNGKFGEFPNPIKSKESFKKVLGVNGIWGWGHNTYSYSLTNNQGPNLFNKVARHARNYHNMNWDVTDPDIKPDYDKMAKGGGTQAQWWLNWDKEYEVWTKAGLEVQASIQFDYPKNAWDSAYQSAYNYGYAFAKHFGPSYGTGHIAMMEVGNEPWFYDSTLYRTILSGMAKGAKAADPKMGLIPCALQAFNRFSDIETSSQNFMGTRVTATEAPYLDGLNVHAYSYLNNQNGIRVATYPEHPLSSMREILSAIRFRNQNMPNKKIYWSEFGWDTGSKNEACTHEECVSEKAGTAYALRAALMGWRWGIERMTWFFYANDVNGSSLYSRSGLLESKNNSFNKKSIFTAFEALLYQIENAYFSGVVREDENAWIYVLGDENDKPTHYIAWRPIDGDDSTSINVTFDTKHEAISAAKLEGLSLQGESIATPQTKNGKMTLAVSSIPIVVKLKPDIIATHENEIDKAFLVYPNPSYDVCFIQSEIPFKKITITDVLGRIAMEKILEHPLNFYEINHSNLQEGLYLIEMLTDKNIKLTQKIKVE